MFGVGGRRLNVFACDAARGGRCAVAVDASDLHGGRVQYQTGFSEGYKFQDASGDRRTGARSQSFTLRCRSVRHCNGSVADGGTCGENQHGRPWTEQ